MVAGIVLLGGPAWAQEDPCAPGPDGSVPEMCQGGEVEESTPEPAEEPAPEPAEEPAPEPGTDPIDPCEGMQPVEPGDGVVSEGDQAQGIAEGEPYPDTPTEEAPAEEGEVKPEPAPEDEPRPEPDAPTMDAPASEDGTVATPAPGTISDDGIICAFAGAPVSAPDTAAGGQEAAPILESATGVRNAATAAGQLPRTGPYDQVIALAAVGSALLIVGAGAAAAGRRRSQEA